MKRVSVKDVARRAGVSAATVSRFHHKPDSLAELTRQRVKKAISETGYRPNALARDLRRGHTNIVLVVVPSIGVPFFGEVMRGIKSVAAQSGISIIVEEMESTPDQAERIASKLVSNQIDGMILLASTPPSSAGFPGFFQDGQRPVVIACEDITSASNQVPAVHIDNFAAAKEATEYLQSMGHRRIALISDKEDSILMRDREAGYRAAMDNGGSEFHESYIAYGDLTIHGASQATRLLLGRSEPFTAIFCLNDEMAIGCISEARKLGLRVPGDLSVVGFDDIPICPFIDPPLTTVHQPAAEIGRRSMHRLWMEIREVDIPGPRTQLVEHSLVIRKSVDRV